MTTPTPPADPGTVCWPSIRGTAMRITKLDSCGRPVVGPHSVLVTDGFITATFAPQYQEGNEVTVTKANGIVCVNDKAPDSLTRFDVTLSLCAVNPALLTLLGGYEAVLDNNAAAVGFRVAESVGSLGVAVEVWTDVFTEEDCVGASSGQYGYFLAPRVVAARISSDFSITNDALSIELQGRTKKGAGWAVGPYNVVATGATGTPGKLLTPLGKKDHLHAQVTTVAPPDPDAYPCGTTALAA
jgi:hypothetical protein